MADVQQALPPDDPMRKAWEAYRQTDEFANTRRWAKYDEHLDGSLWAAFMAGYVAGMREMSDQIRIGAEGRQEAPPAPEATPTGALRWLLDYLAGSIDTENAEAVAALNAEPAIANARKVLSETGGR